MYTWNYYKKENYFCSLLYIKTCGNNINFEDKKIKKTDFYKNRKITKIDDIDVNKILVSKSKPYGTKNSFKYLDIMMM